MSDIKYPCIMRGALSGVIVNMASPSVGTVIGTGHSNKYNIGHYSGGWCMDYMKPYTPKIVKTKGEKSVG